MAESLTAFIAGIKAGRPVAFRDTLAVIAEHYDYRPTRFFNGVGASRLANDPGANEGSCKIFYFARLHGLSVPETLSLFGEYYRDEVLADPGGTGHMNIRTFMEHGWEGIAFEGDALVPKTTP